jgi:hypothetical protein
MRESKKTITGEDIKAEGQVILVLLWNNRFRRREEELMESDRISWATRERERGSHSHIIYSLGRCC